MFSLHSLLLFYSSIPFMKHNRILFVLVVAIKILKRNITFFCQKVLFRQCKGSQFRKISPTMVGPIWLVGTPLSKRLFDFHLLYYTGKVKNILENVLEYTGIWPLILSGHPEKYAHGCISPTNIAFLPNNFNEKYFTKWL